ncbi:sulfotransferase [Bacillus paralicheniformis]|uniref:sulfotransferase n=1 Tax=Bacillus paralicheniformis TaxID=1648923 RepID=UPI0024C1D89F|nr:sulfotransferase [Bacillus paralicheniformis]WHX86983.1 sulfotransferase [Bacillus paralicheniformis]
MGVQRSGTTALSYSLNYEYNKHDGLFTVNGKLIYYLQRWLTDDDIAFRHFRADEISFALRRIMPSGIGAENWLEKVDFILNETAKLVANGTDIDAVSLSRQIVMKAYEDYVLWGDKYNEYMHQIPYIENLFPDAKFILLIRNPFDVSNSILKWNKSKPWRPFSTANNLVKWKIWHEPIISKIRKWEKNKYLIIEYNDLCEGKETERLSDFLNMPFIDTLGNLKLNKKSNISVDLLPPSIKDIWLKLNEFR